MTFQELGLSDAILQAIAEQGYEHPMPIQEEVIPFLTQPQEQHDLVALAQTGTGKTAAYGLPILQRLTDRRLQADASLTTPAQDYQSDHLPHLWREERGGRRMPASLILAPTRELCLQIADDLRGFARYMDDVEILAVYGGANIEPQIRALRHGVDIIVATPGRLIDLMNRGAADLSTIREIILDEADEMLSMGFQEDLDTILQGIPEEHSTLLFSATMSREIERIAQRYLSDARQIQVGSRNEGAENVSHIYYLVRAQDKYLALKRIVDYYPRIYAIIFCRTRMETQEVADNLIRDGYNADALHGELSQQQRDLTMQKFRQHRTQLLVATDVAARGLDVDDLTHVINYGMPDDTENYTHRSGRTGRAGKKGTSICIVHVRERGKIRLVEKVIQKPFEQGVMPEPRDICAKQLYHVIDEIERVEVDEEQIAEFMPEVNRRWEWLDKEDLVRRILSREFGRFLTYYANAPQLTLPETREAKAKGERGGKRRDGHQPEEGYARLFLTISKVDGYYAKEIIKLINDHVRGNKVDVGRIDLMKNFSFVEVAEEDAERVIQGLRGTRIRGREIVCERAEEEAGAGGSQERKAQDKKERKPRDRRERNGRQDKGRTEQRDRRERPQQRDRKEKPRRQHDRDWQEAFADSQPQHKYTKDDWMQFLHPDKKKGKHTQQAPDELVGEEPDFSEEGWARRFPKKKK